MKKFFLIALVLVASFSLKSQADIEPPYAENKVSSGVPFLTIVPDARAAGMGDIGVATSSDITSIFHNPAKYSFSEQKLGVEISYSPWLQKIANDMSINYLAGFFKINETQAFAASLKYFAVGEIQFTNDRGENLKAFKPNEFALSTAYSMKLTDIFSGAVGLKFIYSNLTGGLSTGQSTHAGLAVAGDLAFFMNKPIEIKGNDAAIKWGINLSNIGTKISYAEDLGFFIPANFRTGVGFKYSFDEYNTIEWALDLNKLMVPAPPIYDGKGLSDDNIVAGLPPSVSVPEGIFGSFYDAPNGVSEELHEIMIGTGLEYTYSNTFFIRSGVFYEHPNKGSRRYATAGVGFKFNVFKIDFSYLIPIQSNNPLASTLRFTLAFDFNK